MRKIFFITLCLIFYFKLSAQENWQLVFENNKTIDTLFNYHSEGNPSISEKQCVFVNEEDFASILIGGTNLIKNGQIDDLDIYLQNPIQISPDELSFYLFYRSKNIESYRITLFTIDKKEINFTDKIHSPDYNLYPGPSYFKCLNIDPKYKRLWDSATSFLINKIKISIYSDNPQKAEFVIGNFILLHQASTYEKVIHPFLVDERALGYYTYDPTYSPYLSPQIQFTNSTRSDWHLTFPNNMTYSKKLEQQAIREIIALCLKHYPYYSERNLNKESLIKSYDTLCNKLSDTLDLYYYAQNLKKFLEQFDDKHFDITIPSNKINNIHVTAPLRLEYLDGGFYVSAIFQKEYKNSSLIGRRIYQIDNIKLDSLINQYSNCNPEFINKIILQYITKPKSDSVTYHASDSIFVIQHNRATYIPSNFKPKHRDFKIIQNICYYRLNNFTPGDFIDFCSHIEQIKQSRGIIFDLRGNGGGNSSIAASIISTFIDSPEVYTTTIDIYKNHHSKVIKPHPYFHLKVPIVILIDGNTACASESFAETLRNACKAKIIGKSRSRGAYASLTEIKFPCGIIIKTNIFSNYFLLNNGKNIENNGIEPDIWIDIHSVNDLYPYNDKCLKFAHSYLRQKKD